MSALAPIRFRISSGMSVVVGPSHSPARVFSSSNDFCASGFCALACCSCSCDCANAALASDSKAIDIRIRTDFMFFSLDLSGLQRSQLRLACASRGGTCDLVGFLQLL